MYFINLSDTFNEFHSLTLMAYSSKYRALEEFKEWYDFLRYRVSFSDGKHPFLLSLTDESTNLICWLEYNIDVDGYFHFLFSDGLGNLTEPDLPF